MDEYSDDIMLRVATAALERWDLRVDRIKLVSRSENIVFRVDTIGQGAFALRIHRPGYHTISELNSELAWGKALNAAGIGVPPARETRDGQGYATVEVPDTDETRQVGVVQWFDGETLQARIAAQTDADARASHFAQLGALMARMHDQAVGWQPPAGFDRHSLDADGLMGESPFWGPFWELGVLTDPQRKLVREVRTVLHRRLTELGQAPDTYSVIHADLHALNVLVDGDRLRVIDFDDAGYGWHAYDIAVALFSQHDTPQYDATRDALLAGYRTQRSLDDAVVESLPMFSLIRGLALLGWFHERPGLHPEYVPIVAKSVCRIAEAYR